MQAISNSKETRLGWRPHGFWGFSPWSAFTVIYSWRWARVLWLQGFRRGKPLFSGQPGSGAEEQKKHMPRGTIFSNEAPPPDTPVFNKSLDKGRASTSDLISPYYHLRLRPCLRHISLLGESLSCTPSNNNMHTSMLFLQIHSWTQILRNLHRGP